MVEEAGCKGVLDSVCSKTVAGEQWIEVYLRKFSKSFINKQLVSTPSSKVYQFGGGEKRKSQGCLTLPVVIGNKQI